MANEFRIKHGLIVTGSSYFSESMYAPNLPTEASPDYYITWRASDGRFEISTTSPAQASTMGCWDFAASAASAGGIETDTGGFGSSTTTIYINNEDNNGVNQFNTLQTIGKGSSITLYSGALSTQFNITGVIAPTSNANTKYWELSVTYVSGNQYSPTTGAEVCLGVTAAVASGGSTGQCAEYVASSNFSQAAATSGEGGFDRFFNGSNYYPPFNTVDNKVVGLFFNGTTNKGNSTVSFFNNFAKGDTVSIEYGTRTTYFEINSIGYGQGGVNAYINVSYLSGDLNYSITVGDTYNVCKI